MFLILGMIVEKLREEEFDQIIVLCILVERKVE